MLTLFPRKFFLSAQTAKKKVGTEAVMVVAMEEATAVPHRLDMVRVATEAV